MGELYEKQEDGTLKPIEYPSRLVRNLHTYLWLKVKVEAQRKLSFFGKSHLPINQLWLHV